ncbi:sigma-70 family RNA polymerase sigma factor [Bacillaceae bacterium S4-13-56]
MNRAERGIEWIQEQEPDDILEVIMNEYGPDLMKLAYTYVHDWAKAEDLVQDVFITSYEKLTSFRGESSLKTWLHRVTINKCKDSLKSWSFRNIRSGFDEYYQSTRSTTPTPEQDLIKKDEDSFLADCIMKLPMKYREVILLYYYSELDTEEIAAALKVNSKTIRTRMRRARNLLKDMYEEAGING